MNIVEFKTCMFDLVRSINDSMNSLSKFDYKIYNLTVIQARILMAIYLCKNFTVGELGKAMSISSGNISTLCKKMERAGLLKRIRNEDDERVVKVVLTEKGIDIVEKIQADFEKKYNSIVSKVSEEDLQKIIDGLKMLDLLFKRFQQESISK